MFGMAKKRKKTSINKKQNEVKNGTNKRTTETTSTKESLY